LWQIFVDIFDKNANTFAEDT